MSEAPGAGKETGMNLTIQEREQRGITVLDLVGKVIQGDESTALRDRVRKLVAAKKTKILLDLKQVTFIDSTGAGTVVACYTTARAARGDLKLVHPSDAFRKLLQVTRLDKMLEMHAAEEEALASFS